MKGVSFRLTHEPIAQGRPRMTVIKGMARAFDPKKSREWKAFINEFAQGAMGDAGYDQPFSGPIVGRMRFGFALPKSARRKRTPPPRQWHTKRPDVDNLVKAILDACKSVVFLDDTQIVRLVADKIICAQDEPPFVAISFKQLAPFTDGASK